MSNINQKWFSPQQKTIIVNFDRPWTAPDLEQAVRDTRHMLKDVKQDVTLIIWHHVLPNPDMYRALNNIQKQLPSNIRRMVIVPHQWSMGIMLMTTWAGIVERLNPKKAKLTMVETIDEAYKLAGESVVVPV